jgi:hypothetical protein
MKVNRLHLAWLLCLTSFANGATFSITPSAVSNNYAGNITWNIGGLTNGEMVIVEKYFDANTNSLIDAADLLMQRLRIVDGLANVYYDGTNAVTNRNIPSDLTPTNGAITALVSIAGDVAQQIVGRYHLKLSSPSGRFATVTNSFDVVNFPYSQSFLGVVQSSGTNVPNAIVMVTRGGNQSSTPFAGVVANNAGHYTIKLPPDSYGFWVFKSNYVAVMSNSPVVTLGAGTTISTNVNFLTPATRTISGRFVNAANTNFGPGGLFVFCQSADNRNAGGVFTSTNGSFTIPVTEGQWEVSMDSDSLAAFGHIDLQEHPTVNTTTGDVAGVTIALPRATALVYGSVRDEQNQPMPGVRFYPSDNSNQYQAYGVTDQNGEFCIGATSGGWQIGIAGSESEFTNRIFSQEVQVALSLGQAVRLDFSALLATNRITGFVRDANTTNGIAEVGVNAWANLNGTNYRQYASTAASGQYSLNVANGTWRVSVNCHCNYSDCLGEVYRCPEDQIFNLSNNNAVANFNVYPVWFPVLSQPMQVGPGQVGCLLNGAVGTNYTVLASTNISLPMANWFPVFVTNLTTGTALLLDTQATKKQMFYRVEVGP